MTNNNTAGLIIVVPNKEPKQYAAIYRVVGMAGENWLASPSTVSRGNRIESLGKKLEYFSPYDYQDYDIYEDEEAALPHILELDRITDEERRAWTQNKPKAKAVTNDNVPVPDYAKLDQAVAGNALLVQAVAEIRKSYGMLRAIDLVKPLGIDSPKARYLVHTLGELGFGVILPFHTIRLHERYLMPGQSVHDVMDKVSLTA